MSFIEDILEDGSDVDMPAMRDYLAARETIRVPEDDGAVGDRVAADTASLQASLDRTGLIWLQHGKSYRLTGQLEIDSDTVIDGQGELYIDYTLAGGSFALSAVGSQGVSRLLTADVATTDTSLTMSSSAGFVAGGYAIIGDDRYGAGGVAYPIQVLPVKSVSTGVVELSGPVGVTYLTANDAWVIPLTPKENVAVRNIRIAFSPTANIRELLVFDGCANARVEDLTIIGHRCTDVQPTSAAKAIYARSCANVWVDNNGLRGQNVSGVGAMIAASSNAHVGGNTTEFYDFGVEMTNSFAPTVSPNSLRGGLIAGSPSYRAVRGFKINGCKGVTGDIGHVTDFATGLKIDDCDRFDLAARVWNCGHDGSHAVSIGSLTSADALACERGTLDLRINGTGSGGGYAVYVDTFAPYTKIDAKIFAAYGGGILCQSNNCEIRGEVNEWDTLGVHDATKAAVRFAQASDVDVRCVAADPAKISFATTGSFPANNGGRFAGYSLTNPVDSGSVADINTLHFGNMNVKGLPRIFRGTAAPVSGAYIVGDTVINTVPSAGGTYAWVCTTAGTPGTWKAIALAA